MRLLGDAVHLMPPFGSNGGNGALRDAAQLGRALGEAMHGSVSIEAALSSYQDQMVHSSTREVRSSQRVMRPLLSGSPLIRFPMLRVVPAVRQLLESRSRSL